MSLDPNEIDVLVFDYGNTLAPFGAEQYAAVTASMHQNLERLFGPIDPHHVDLLLTKARKAPYAGAAPSLKEHDYEVLLTHVVTTLYNHVPDPVRIEQLRFAQYSHFVNLIVIEQSVRDLLARLKERYRLAMLSNYVDTHAIRDSLRVHHLRAFFENVAVSGEIGYVKPHPVTFAQVLAPFKLPTHRAVYIGDNWEMDVQGAKRVGMKAIYTTQYAPTEPANIGASDFSADHTIAHLNELEALLL